MSSFEANWEPTLVTAEAVHGIGFAFHLVEEVGEDAHKAMTAPTAEAEAAD